MNDNDNCVTGNWERKHSTMLQFVHFQFGHIKGHIVLKFLPNKTETKAVEGIGIIYEMAY